MASSKTEQDLGHERSESPRPPRRPGHTVAELLSEDLFLQSVQREMRRAERSGRFFALVLITSNAFRRDRGRALACHLATAIQGSIRETDWLGWYEYQKTFGIVLTEIGAASEVNLALLSQKIGWAMHEAVSPQDFQALSITIRFFPQNGDSGPSDKTGSRGYCELQRKIGPGSWQTTTTRAVDIAGSLLALLLFLPVFLLIAVLVKLTSPGPVMYRQKRVGLYGRLFDFYKFRSMYSNNDPGVHRQYVIQLIEGGPQVQQSNGMYKLASDPRVTRLGRFLRKSSLDELPQFFNVLRGDMSLVGPRPPLPYEFERYRPWHRRRVLEIKPGITGLWQVKGRSRTTFEEMVRMDLQYARTRSLWTDIKLILQTPGAMFSGHGAC